MLSIEIHEDNLTGPEIVRFLRDHLEYMYSITPPESVHAFDLERLRAVREPASMACFGADTWDLVVRQARSAGLLGRLGGLGQR